MPSILLGPLAELGAASVPRLTGIVRYGLREIISSQFTQWSLEAIMRDLFLSTPLEASRLLQFSLEGILTGEQLWQGNISAFEAASRAPIAVVTHGKGGGLQTYIYRVVYNIGLEAGQRQDTQSILVQSQIPLDAGQITSQVEQDVKSPKQPPTIVGGLGPDYTSIIIVGIDFMLVVQ